MNSFNKVPHQHEALVHQVECLLASTQEIKVAVEAEKRKGISSTEEHEVALKS